MAEVTCEACDSDDPIGGGKFGSEWGDIAGARFCYACLIRDTDKVVADIRRRRSEAGQGARFKVGDRVHHIHDHSQMLGVVTAVGVEYMTGDNSGIAVDWANGNNTVPHAKNLRLAPPAEERGEVEQAKCGGPLGMHPMVDGVCCYCKRTNEQMRADGLKLLEVPQPAVTKRHGFTAGEKAAREHQAYLTHALWAPFALAEVERQLALVARLDFDLKMLRLLGQGWSRGDLAAHLARLTPGGRK